MLIKASYLDITYMIQDQAPFENNFILLYVTKLKANGE